jgi:dihydroflavonol-4-reductase
MLSDRFRIRGCVRDLKSKQEMGPLRRYFGERLATVQIVSCDLSNKLSMDKVVEGSTYVIHIASPVPGPNVRYEEEVINPAVSGVMYILEAAQKYKVKRVVMTSSICACSEFKNGIVPKVIDDSYWSDMGSPNMSAYTKSKLLSEEAAWNFVNTIPTRGPYHRVELVTLLPGFVVGRCITTGKNTSTSIIKQFMQGKFECIPMQQVSICDVEDVAIAHLRACTVEKAGGHRIILSAKSIWISEIA